ncbi:hypothetical protein SAMN05216525_13341 [Bradyrhizobium sp. Gha]|nr:hypothetical protein SAMN05216525_13341 [Bradyrhizobium sp. Gha]
MPDQDRSKSSPPQIFLDWKEERLIDVGEDTWIQAFMDRFLELLRAIGRKPKE